MAVNFTRVQAGVPSGGQFAASSRDEAGVTVTPEVDRTFFPQAPLTAHDSDLLAENRGVFADGYTEDGINRLFAQFDSAHLICVWDTYDDYGYGGDSDFAGMATDGPRGAHRGSWRVVHPDVWRHLNDPDSDVDVERIPSLLTDEVFNGWGDLDDMHGDGFHNVAATSAFDSDDDDKGDDE